MIAASSPPPFGNEDPFDALSHLPQPATFRIQISRVQYCTSTMLLSCTGFTPPEVIGGAGPNTVGARIIVMTLELPLLVGSGAF